MRSSFHPEDPTVNNIYQFLTVIASDQAFYGRSDLAATLLKTQVHPGYNLESVIEAVRAAMGLAARRETGDEARRVAELAVGKWYDGM